MTVARGLPLDVKRALIVTAVGLAGVPGGRAVSCGRAGCADATVVRWCDPGGRGIRAAVRVAELAATGPVPFAERLGNELPSGVDHHGDDPTVGWVTVSARVPGSTGCLVQWDADGGTTGDGVFVDGCDSTTTWPADGAGLAPLAWTVLAGELRIDVARTGGTSP